MNTKTIAQVAHAYVFAWLQDAINSGCFSSPINFEGNPFSAGYSTEPVPQPCEKIAKLAAVMARGLLAGMAEKGSRFYMHGDRCRFGDVEAHRAFTLMAQIEAKGGTIFDDVSAILEFCNTSPAPSENRTAAARMGII